MTEHTLTAEFDYFTIDIDDLVAQAITGGGMVDASDRAKSAIEYIHDAIEARGTAYGFSAWSLAIDTYVKMLMGDRSYHDLWSGCVQGDSLTDSPLQFWIVPMSSQNRGSLSGYSYMVLYTTGYMVGQIDGAFMCDSQEVAADIIQPTRAYVECNNEACEARYIVTDGCRLYAYDSDSGMETGERLEEFTYDADGIDCPACTVYATRQAEDDTRHNSADNVIVEGEPYSTRPNMPGYLFDAFKLRAWLYIGD